MSNEFKVESQINEPFITLPKNVMIELDVYDLAVYSHLKGYMNYQTKKCYPSLNRLKDEIGIGKDRLIKSIKSLESKGFISIEKEQNSVNKYTFLDFKTPSRSNRPPIEVVVETDSGSRLERPQVVVENDTNKKKLTKRNNENKERDIEQGEKYSKAKLIKSVELQKEFFKEKLKDFINKYTRDQLNEFYKFWTLPCNVTGETRFAKVLKSKDKNFVLANRLANAKRNGHLDKPKNNQSNQPKTFAQLEREDYREQMRKIQETYDSFDDMLLNEVAVYE